MLRLRRKLQPAPPLPDPTSKHRGSTYVRFKDVKIGGAFSYRNVLGVIMEMHKLDDETGCYVESPTTTVQRLMAPDTSVATTEDQLHLHIQMKLQQKRGGETLVPIGRRPEQFSIPTQFHYVRSAALVRFMWGSQTLIGEVYRPRDCDYIRVHERDLDIHLTPGDEVWVRDRGDLREVPPWR